MWRIVRGRPPALLPIVNRHEDENVGNTKERPFPGGRVLRCGSEESGLERSVEDRGRQALCSGRADRPLNNLE